VLSLPAKELEEIAINNGGELPRRLATPTSGEVFSIGAANQSLRRMLQHVIDTPGSAIDEDTELALSLSLLEAADYAEDRKITTSAAKRSKALKNALEVIAARRDDPPSVSELCTLTGAPVRTLSRAFKERFGVGPKAYINQLRLSRVRGSIVIGEPGTTIASLANQQGFWHMGQFAKDYKTLFGELPSETANKKHARVLGGLPSKAGFID
jgi:transcriptional regulator GlxA family with amidase domain